MANQIEALLTSKEAGAILRMNPKVVERMAKRGEVPGFKLGRAFRYSPLALQAWIDAKSRGSVAPNEHASVPF
jgi:hypothetical protein